MLASLAAAPYLIIVLLAQIPLPVINLQKKTALLQVIPVKVIRKDVIWARDDQSLNYATLDECNDKVGLKYIND